MNIVCHAFPAWEGNYVKSTVELMKSAAAQGHRVLYVDYAYTWTDFFKSLIGKSTANWRRMLGLEPRLQAVEIAGAADGLQQLTLSPVFPANFIRQPWLYDAVNRMNSFLMGRQIRRAIRDLGMQDPTVINAFNPAFGLHLAGKLGEKRLLYYCYDEIGAAHWAKRHGARLEAAFIQKCDAVLVSSQGLLQKQQAQHPSVFLVKNGVDAELFSAEVPAAGRPQLPGQRAGERVIGYLGSVDERLDLDLLEKLFVRFAAARFVFVGRVQNEALRLRLSAFPNVFLAGAFPTAALPGWVARMDVCLIPFVKNEFTRNIYPLKINEYLAAGKSVVSTPFAPLDDFKDMIAIGDTAAAFEHAVQEAMQAAPDSDAKRRRQAFARQNAWSERAAEMMRVAICRNQRELV